MVSASDWGSEGRRFESAYPDWMFWVYVLQSEVTGRRYTGSCEDLDDRLRRHNAGHSAATKHGVPWRLIYKESYSSRSEAVRRELYLKSGVGRDELERILTGVQRG